MRLVKDINGNVLNLEMMTHMVVGREGELPQPPRSIPDEILELELVAMSSGYNREVVGDFIDETIAKLLMGRTEEQYFGDETAKYRGALASYNANNKEYQVYISGLGTPFTLEHNPFEEVI